MGGGIDSSTVACYYAAQNRTVVGLHYDYGQPTARAERRSVRAICKKYQIPFCARSLNLTLGREGEEIKARNALFILAAAAEFCKSPIVIALGAHARSTHYDATPSFMADIQRLLDGYFSGLAVASAPFITWQKAAVVSYAREQGIPLTSTFSCQVGPTKPCGSCNSCKDREVLNA